MKVWVDVLTCIAQLVDFDNLMLDDSLFKSADFWLNYFKEHTSHFLTARLIFWTNLPKVPVENGNSLFDLFFGRRMHVP